MPDIRRLFAVLGLLTLGACTYSGPATDDSSSVSRGAPSTSASVSSSSSSSAAAPRIEVLNCDGQRPRSSPSTLYLTCGDGTVSVQGIRWSSFGASSAHGAGTLHRRGCTPNCASGTVTTIPAQVTLSEPGRRNGRLIYRRLLVEPAGTASTTLRLPA